MLPAVILPPINGSDIDTIKSSFSSVSPCVPNTTLQELADISFVILPDFTFIVVLLFDPFFTPSIDSTTPLSTFKVPLYLYIFPKTDPLFNVTVPDVE